MSLVARRLPRVLRIPTPTPRVLSRFNSSNPPKDIPPTPSQPPSTAEDIQKAVAGTFYALPDPVYDNTDQHFFNPAVDGGSHVLDSNYEPMFFDLNMINKNGWGEREDIDPEDPEESHLADEAAEEANSPMHHLPIPFNKLRSLFRFPMYGRRVVQQTGKGKINHQYVLMIVGNGRGLVGLGEGKADEAAQAADKAFAQAVRNLDYVDRFEGRTLWTEIDTKFGATRLVMRPRPVGFGLMCAPGIHQVFKAAGIKDASVKIWGSRNKINVIKAAIRVLHAGHMPVALGNGIGGQGRRLEKGSGMRGKSAVERERGRRIIDARTW
ncbi:hypothetical protein K439DRAFT_1634189 [Ramaria rubella]|nr:hypothetical protein K439DRAFT_1634189 [Ramaria rubella]